MEGFYDYIVCVVHYMYHRTLQPGSRMTFPGCVGWDVTLVNKFPYSFPGSRGFIAGTNDNQLGLSLRDRRGDLLPNEPSVPGLAPDGIGEARLPTSVQCAILRDGGASW